MSDEPNAVLELAIRLARPCLWLGEAVTASIEVRHIDGPAPVELPAHWTVGDSWLSVGLTFRGERVTLTHSPDEIDESDSPRTISLVNLGNYSLDLRLDQWHEFTAGRYALTVQTRLPQCESRSASIEFEVFDPQASFLVASQPDGQHGSLCATIAVSGERHAAIFERTFEGDVENDLDLTRWQDRQRLTLDRSVAGLATPSSAASHRWLLWRDIDGICASPGIDSFGAIAREGVAFARSSDAGASSIVLEPAFEQPDGALLINICEPRENAVALRSQRFLPPVIEIEEPDGPEDWDDEILVPGRVENVDIGEIPLPGFCHALVFDDTTDRFVALSQTEHGVRLDLVRFGEGQATSTHIGSAQGRIPPGAPSIVHGAIDARRVTCLLVRQRVDSPAATDLVAFTATLQSDGEPLVSEDRLVTLNTTIASAAIVAEPGGSDDQWRGAIVDDSGAVHSVDSSANYERIEIESPMLPLRLVADSSSVHLVRLTPLGPVLQRI